MTDTERYYEAFAGKVSGCREVLGRPMTCSEKILYSHLAGPVRKLARAEDYAGFKPDRVAMQDATAQMALLQFMNAGKDRVCVPSTVHCDHLIQACCGAEKDLPAALETNAEVYEFLSSAAARYGIGFWKPGAGIIHQEVLENYAFPGGMMVGTDSHTPNAGGLGMLAIGVGGADAVDVMTGMEWELKVPKIIGVKLDGKLGPWATPKDVILHLAGILTVKGGTNAVIEYFGEGAESISCTGKATICNMGAEVGATCSVFPYDEKMAAYLCATGREETAALCGQYSEYLRADEQVLAEPEKYFDRLVEIDLSQIEPLANGPFTPDLSHPVSDIGAFLEKENYPVEVSASLIGSCTNSSYQDLAAAADVARQAVEAGLKPKAKLIVNPGSEQIRLTAERDGILDILRKAGAVIMTNACGPCIGQWQRNAENPLARNIIVTSFNRNFAKRADGNPNTHAFIVSPQLAVVLSFAGRLDFNPQTDSIEGFSFVAPDAPELPQDGFVRATDGYVAPLEGAPEPVIRPSSDRIQRLESFPAWDGEDMNGLRLLMKTKGKCTTDHISMAGKWLRFRGHLDHISDNLLLGATNAFNGRTGEVFNIAQAQEMTVSASARVYRKAGIGTVIVAEDNYGEGSSREHAAMEPRYLGVKAVLAKSFARIHETNLKKQGVLALTFAEPSDYEKIREDDLIDIACSGIAPGSTVKMVLHHKDGSIESFDTKHTYNNQQISWFKAGSALNSLK